MWVCRDVCEFGVCVCGCVGMHVWVCRDVCEFGVCVCGCVGMCVWVWGMCI